MKRILLTTCFWLMGLLALSAQTMAEAFKAMPDSLLPLLSRNNRLDCLDFKASNMRAIVDNRFGGKSEMTSLTPDYLALSLSESSRCEMKMLPSSEGKKCIVVVKTYEAPAAESELSCYTSAWRPKKLELLPALPTVDDFWQIPDSVESYRAEELKRGLGVAYLAAQLSPDGATLSFSLSLKALSVEQQKELAPYLKKEVVYTWREGAFRK